MEVSGHHSPFQNSSKTKWAFQELKTRPSSHAVHVLMRSSGDHCVASHGISSVSRPSMARPKRRLYIYYNSTQQSAHLELARQMKLWNHLLPHVGVARYHFCAATSLPAEQQRASCSFAASDLCVPLLPPWVPALCLSLPFSFFMPSCLKPRLP